MLSTNYSGELQWYKDGEAIEDSKETSYKPVVSGSYQVEHTMDNGLKIRSQSVQVEVIESPILSFYSEINIVRPNEVINLNSTSENVTDLEWLLKGDNYEQSFFGDTPEIRLGDPGVYDVHLIGESGSTGCRDTLIKEDYLKVLSEAELEDDVFIPNIFTPNGDGKNDILYARGGDLVEIEFLIFNKEGQLVFSSNAKEFGWDGNISGSAPLVGNYSYLLKYVNRFGTKKTLKGKFVLHK
jgi:gliding motility-associated-like protein